MRTLKSLAVALLAGATLLAPGAASAKTEEVATKATGTGRTETEALGNALARAVAQVNGGNASISTRTTRTETNLDIVTDEGASTHRKHESETSPADFTASGAVARYEVLSSRKKGDKEYEVTVRAWVNKYVAKSKRDKLDRMALAPVYHTGVPLKFLDAEDSARLAVLLHKGMERALLRTGNFQLLDRLVLDQSLKELNLIGSNLSAPEEQAKLKSIRGADYLLTSSIEATEVGRVNPATGQAAKPKLAFEVRVVSPATSEVLFLSREPLLTAGYSKAEPALEAMAERVVAGLDVELNGKTKLKPADAPSEDSTPRDDSGVKLPFDR